MANPVTATFRLYYEHLLTDPLLSGKKGIEIFDLTQIDRVSFHYTKYNPAVPTEKHPTRTVDATLGKDFAEASAALEADSHYRVQTTVDSRWTEGATSIAFEFDTASDVVFTFYVGKLINATTDAVIDDATVTVTNAGGSDWVEQTRADGIFIFCGVPVGEFPVSFAKTGFTTLNADIKFSTESVAIPPVWEIEPV